MMKIPTQAEESYSFLSLRPIGHEYLLCVPTDIDYGHIIIYFVNAWHYMSIISPSHISTGKMCPVQWQAYMCSLCVVQ